MPTERYVSIEEIRHSLGFLYRADPETNLQSAFLRALSDPLKPVDAKGRRRLNPFFILLVLVFCALAGIFLYFNLGVQQ